MAVAGGVSAASLSFGSLATRITVSIIATKNPNATREYALTPFSPGKFGLRLGSTNAEMRAKAMKARATTPSTIFALVERPAATSIGGNLPRLGDGGQSLRPRAGVASII